MSLLLAAAAFVASLLLIHVGSEKIVDAASHLAFSLNLRKVIIGTILVASITSAPELASSLMAAIFNSSQMALGNVIGSNIYNVPLLLGICGLIRGFRIRSHTVARECMFMLGLSALLMIMTAATGMVTWWMGVIFLALYAAFIYHLIRRGKHSKRAVNRERKEGKRTIKYIAIMVLGGAALLSGTYLLVYSTITVAEIFGLSHFYAGFTIMALGCVIPEVAVSVSAALHGEPEISVGNVIGDNIITMTLVLGLISLIRSFAVSLQEILATVPFMMLITLLLFAISKRGYRITRAWSLLMLIVVVVTLMLDKLGFG